MTTKGEIIRDEDGNIIEVSISKVDKAALEKSIKEKKKQTQEQTTIRK